MNLQENISRIKRLINILSEDNSDRENFRKYQSLLSDLFSTEFDVDYAIYGENKGESDWFPGSTIPGEWTGKVLRRKVKPIVTDLHIRPKATTTWDENPNFEDKSLMVELMVLFPNLDIGSDEHEVRMSNQWDLHYPIQDILNKHGLRRLIGRAAMPFEGVKPMDFILQMGKIEDKNRYISTNGGVTRGNEKIVDFIYNNFSD